MTYYKILKDHKISITKPDYYPATFYRRGNMIYCDGPFFGNNYARPDLTAAELSRHINQMITEKFTVTIS